MLIIETTYNEQEKVWQGAENQFFIDPLITIGDVVLDALKENGGKPFEISHETDAILTYAEVLTRSVRLAQFLQEQGLTQNDVVGILTRSNPYESQVLFACLFNATPFHNITGYLEPDAITALYAISKPKIIFCDGCDYALIKGATSDWQPIIVTLDNHVTNVLKIEDLITSSRGNERDYRPARLVRGAEQIMGILCTSGTTGLPKATTLSNAQLVMLMTSGNPSDILYIPSGLHWISGVKALLISLVSAAPRVVSRHSFSPQLFVDVIQKHKVTICFISSWEFHTLFSSPLATSEALSSIQVFLVGGGWVSSVIMQSALSILGSALVCVAYGTTETDVVTVAMNPDKENMVGAIVAGRMVRIVNEQGVSLGPNELGEILIKTNQFWNGYYNDPEQTARTIDAQGWFHMGDLGYFDDEGQLYVVDRKKDLLKYRSMHYTPNEIERVIVELPDVQEVCVVGIRDKFQGDAAGALIRLKPNSILSEREVIDHVARRIPVDYKHLHAGVRFVDRIPFNSSGKLLRDKAKKLFHMSHIPKASL